MTSSSRFLTSTAFNDHTINSIQMNYRIFPPEELPECSIPLPLSKSMSARAAIINALQHCDNTGLQLADCTDTEAILKGVSTMSGTVDLGNSGTSMRFLTAFFAATPGAEVVLDGCKRMRLRPIGPLVQALRDCGASIQYMDEEGFPPLKINGSHLKGGHISIDATVSSQFISALMMVAPYMEQGLKISLDGELASRPYMMMTAEMMTRAGASVETRPEYIEIRPIPYTAPVTEIEADWSAAAFWYEIEALTSGFITLEGQLHPSVQGDALTAGIFANLGVDTEFTASGAELVASPELSPRLQLDLSATPDLVPALVVTCVMLRIPFQFSGLETLTVKECNRVEALCQEMLLIGAVLDPSLPGTLSWDGMPRPIQELPVFSSHSDHRIAMALAPVAAYLPGIVVCEAECVAKSYPDFWEQMRLAGFIVQDENDPIPPQFTDQ